MNSCPRLPAILTQTVETWCPAKLRRTKKEVYNGYAYDVKMWSISRIYIKM